MFFEGRLLHELKDIGAKIEVVNKVLFKTNSLLFIDFDLLDFKNIKLG
jgi:hypothetical protein